MPSSWATSRGPFGPIAKLAPSMKIGIEKSTLARRDSEAVAELHSRSALPSAMASNRLVELTGT